MPAICHMMALLHVGCHVNQPGILSHFYYKADPNDATDRLAISLQQHMHPCHACQLPSGPMGQCHPIPDDARLKAQMRLHARNAWKVHQAYNLPYEVEPGSDLDKAIQLDQRRQARNRDLYESEQDAEQRRLQRFSRLRQKRTGGMRVRQHSQACCYFSVITSSSIRPSSSISMFPKAGKVAARMRGSGAMLCQTGIRMSLSCSLSLPMSPSFLAIWHCCFSVAAAHAARHASNGMQGGHESCPLGSMARLLAEGCLQCRAAGGQS